MNPFDELDGAVLEGDVLTPVEPTLKDRFVTNRDDGFYSGTLTGAVRGATSDVFEKQKVRDRYDSFPQWQTPLEGVTSLAGQLVGSAASMENYVPLTWGTKAVAAIGFKMPAVAARFFSGAIDAGIVNAATDTGVQAIELANKQREEFSLPELAQTTALGTVIGGTVKAALPGGAANAPVELPHSLATEVIDLGDQLDAKARQVRNLGKRVNAKPIENVTPSTADAVSPPEPVAAMIKSFDERIYDFAQEAKAIDENADILTPEGRLKSALAHAGGEIGLGYDTASQSIKWALEGNRRDAAEFILERFKRQAETANVEPGVPKSASNYQQIKDSLAARKQRFMDEAATLSKQLGIAPDKPRGKGGSIPAADAADEFSAAAQPSAGRAGALERDKAGVAAVAAQADTPAFTRVKEISEKLADALDAAAVRQGHISVKVQGKKGAGQFSGRSGVIRLAKPDDFDVLTHELGHHLEISIGKPVQALMKAHEKELLPMAYAGSRKGSELKEGFAEFIRVFVTNPAYAAKQAPQFDAALRAMMAKDHADIGAAMTEATTAWRVWLDQPSVDAVASTIVSGKEPKHFAEARKDLAKLGLGNTIADRLSRAYAMAFDDLNPLFKAGQALSRIYQENTGKVLDLKVAQDPYKLARMSRGAWNAGHVDITHGVHAYRGTKPVTASLRDALVMAMGKPNVLSGWDETLSRRFGAYLWSRRALGEWSRFDQGLIPNPPDKLTRGDHAQNIKDTEAAHKEFAAAAKMVHEWATALWTKKRDAGLITDKQWQEGMAIKDYVPGMRAFDQDGDATGVGGRGGDGKSGFVKQFKGSRRDVINPIESLMADAYETSMAIARNEVIKQLDRMALIAGPGGGAIAERIPSHQLKATMVDPLEAMDAAAKQAGLGVVDYLPLRDALEASIGNDKVAIFRPAVINERGEPIAFFRDAGELKALRLADGKFGMQMYSALTMMSRPEANIFIEMLSKPAAILRTGITASPEFVLANFIRDQTTAMIFYGKPFKRVAGAIAGMGDELLGSDAARAYNQAGGIMGGANVAALSDVRVRSDMNALRKKGWAVETVTSLRGVLQATEISETGMRLGLFKSFFAEAKQRGLDDFEAQLEAAYRARDHLDFDRRGTAMTGLSRLIPFLNASLQGIDKGARQMIAPLFGRANSVADKAARGEAVKAWARLSALTVASMGLHALMSEHDEYRDLNPQTRATHWMVKWGDKWIAVPKPFELAAIINLGEAAYDAMAMRDPRWAGQYLDSLMTVAMPPNVMEGNPTIATAYELAAGVDLRTGDALIPPGMEGMEPWLQFTARTSEISKMLGKAINVSPSIIDHVITAHTGSLGRNGLALYDYAASDKPAQGWDDIAILRRFIKDGSRGSTSTRAFWDMVSTRTGTLEGARKSYQMMVDGGDPAGAADYLADQNEITRAWIAAGSVKAEARRIHPFLRAQLAVTAINALRREMAGSVIKTAAGEVKISRVDRGAADDILESLAMTTARNSLVLMQVPGWEARETIEEASFMRELQAVSPDIARALADRFAEGKVLPQTSVEQLWPEFRTRLLRDGSAMQSADLAARAKAAGFEMYGTALKRRERAVVPGVGG